MIECTNFGAILTIIVSTLTILGAIVTTFVFLFREIKSLENKVDQDVKSVNTRTDKLYELFSENTTKINERTGKLYELFNENTAKINERTDKLYETLNETLVALLRERKGNA